MEDVVLLDVDALNELIFEEFDQAGGEDTEARIKKQIESYKYYEGYQHRHPETGELVKDEDIPRPLGFDYDPTRVTTNYFKALIDRKARWQMGGNHSVVVPRRQLDEKELTMEPDYEPSEEQKKELERAKNLEDLIMQLWEDNRMKERLLASARDRLLGGRVVCKLVWSAKHGKLRWLFRPDYEYIPVYSEDDFEELISANFLIPRKVLQDGETKEAVLVQRYTLEGDTPESSQCYIEETLYLTEDMSVIEKVTPRSPMGLDFIPVVEFPVETLSAKAGGNTETEGIRRLNDILIQLNEDAIDSLRFEMFPITAFIDVPEGTVNKVAIAPGAQLEVQGQSDGLRPTIEKIESRFSWKEPLKDQYNRIKSSMHEITGLPQVVPSEMNIGGLNDEALRILFQDIIADTEEHWLSWHYGMTELHEKSIKFLQARTTESNFSYDKDVLRSLEDYETEVVFALPLPDNRKDKVKLLSEEINNNLESRKGAMERLGVQDVQAKLAEIENEQLREKMLDDPYGGAGAGGSIQAGGATGGAEERINENGEVEEICPTCGGSGKTISEVTNEEITCPTCKGTGWHQPRKR